MNNIEILGYVASVLVAISLTMNKLLRLRVINLVGAVTFAIYGYFVGAYPVMIVNTFIVGINIYYLIRMFMTREEFDILEASNNEYLYRFYDHYSDDINNFFPDFNDENLKNKKSIFILRNMRPVNLVVYNEQSDGIIEILLDYTIAEYRDFLNGKYLLSLFRGGNQGRQLVVKTESRDHIKYLERMGFKRNQAGLFVNKI